jgi:hypothetical protein
VPRYADLDTIVGHALAGTCFAAGTLIHTTRGLVPIEEIKVGAHVISRADDFNRAENASNKVMELYRYSDKAVLEVTFAGSGETMLVTPEHTFAHVSNRWVRASELTPGDRIWTINGAFAEIEAVAETPDPVDVFNFAVENYDALGAELDKLFSQKPTEYWVKRLGANDVPFAPINRVDAAVKDPQVKHLGLMVPVENPHAATHAVRPAVQFDGQRADGVRAAPLINEHGAAIRAALAKSSSWPE